MVDSRIQGVSSQMSNDTVTDTDKFTKRSLRFKMVSKHRKQSLNKKKIKGSIMELLSYLRFWIIFENIAVIMGQSVQYSISFWIK